MRDVEVELGASLRLASDPAAGSADDPSEFRIQSLLPAVLRPAPAPGSL